MKQKSTSPDSVMAGEHRRTAASPSPSAIAADEGAPVHRRSNEVHHWVRGSVGSATVVTLPLEISLSVSYGRSNADSILVRWRMGPADQRAPSIRHCVVLIFLMFHRFEYQLQKFISRARSVQMG